MSRSVRIGRVGATTTLGQEIASVLADESDLAQNALASARARFLAD